MSKIGLFTVALLAFTQSALAVDLPSAGGQIQQIPPPPTLQKESPTIQLKESTTTETPATDKVRIPVRSLHLTGQVLYSEADLVARTGFISGTELTLAELRDMAAKIADYYHNNGYFVAQAYLPAQDIKDGVVTIAVLEGHYGNITLQNHTNLADGLATGLLDGIDSGDTIAIEPLENRLLLLSDLPGVNVKSTLVPGATLGTSNLITEVHPGRRVTGNVEADNAGNYYTGEYRIGATVNVNNPLGHGDVFSLRAMTSGSGMNYGRASYQSQFGKATAGVAYSVMGYELGRDFEDLDAHGTAQIASLYGIYPLLRSREGNIYALLDLDAKTFRDKIDLYSTVTEKDALAVTASLNGNLRDRFAGGGLTSYSLAATFGHLDIETDWLLAQDEASAQTNGHYEKLGFNMARLQTITEKVSLYGSVKGQLSLHNLDISEKMELGGPYAVRAYPVGEAYADEGYVATLEARLLLPKFTASQPGQVHLIGFADTGRVTINQDPWTNEDNHRTLSGAGVGLTWGEQNNFAVNTYYAVKLGNEDAQSAPDESGRFWIQLVKYF